MKIARAHRPAILIVEDDPIIRWSGAETLMEAGFEVLEAGNAAEALRLLENHGAVRVLFTDVDMPGKMDGLELARIAAHRWPCIHIIVASGRREPQMRQMPDNGRFIPKPYMPEQIVRDIDELLAA
jgi:two-component system, response regulator PdtaR